MKIKNVKIQLIALVSLYLANMSSAFAGLPQDSTQVPEPSAIALFAIAGAIAFIIKKRNK
ncbi:MAG: PEP-CTERM sorting domain-containing protein [Colwellia sp.]|nr:PEP-CTERM sorting domain-containing protein [Colwellia sp.]